MAMKSWKAICKPKERRGLGFKRFSYINAALMSKLEWKVATNEDNMWVKMLQAKYIKGTSFFACKPKAMDSMVWKGILSTKEVLRLGSCFKVGDGWNINPWCDPWLPEIQEKFLKSWRAGI